MRLGHYYEEGDSKFRVFAPTKRKLELLIKRNGEEKIFSLQKNKVGYWEGVLPRLEEGTEYKFLINGNGYPDTASLRQKGGVHGFSTITEIPTRKDEKNWKGISMADAIIYELHIGTFSQRGDIGGVIEKLDYLEELGVNVIELLPINPCPGKYNWGYDGNFLFALNENYGTYQELQELIQQAHKRGMAVILDVVYNHLGPEGNYKTAFAPYLKKADTPWGEAVNFDEEYNYGIRHYFLENTRYWLQDIGFDGFRMDAVSLIFDNMPVHILREITDLAKKIGIEENREIIMIAEHLRNNRYVTESSGFNYDSQWGDDLNHAIYAKLTGEKRGHYKDFGDIEDIVKGLREGFVLDGKRYSKSFKYFVGTSGEDMEPGKLVVHIQNHDQVGNRPFGDRMIATYGKERALLGITAVMASPYIPMLWQGEEYGESNPFTFFCDFGDIGIIDGVRKGRKEAYDYLEEDRDSIIDPNSEEAFLLSKNDWSKLKKDENLEILNYYKKIIEMKKSGIIGPRVLDMEIFHDGEVIFVNSDKSLVILNFGKEESIIKVEKGSKLLLSQDGNLEIKEGRLTLKGYTSCVIG
ncbi:MAG: malto-oligosyltrehalose trehalohydrolase [Fusobacteriaceae bacterium]